MRLWIYPESPIATVRITTTTALSFKTSLDFIIVPDSDCAWLSVEGKNYPQVLEYTPA